MYGGHITDAWDRKLCRVYLEEFMNPSLVRHFKTCYTEEKSLVRNVQIIFLCMEFLDVPKDADLP